MAVILTAGRPSDATDYVCRWRIRPAPQGNSAMTTTIPKDYAKLLDEVSSGSRDVASAREIISELVADGSLTVSQWQTYLASALSNGAIDFARAMALGQVTETVSVSVNPEAYHGSGGVSLRLNPVKRTGKTGRQVTSVVHIDLPSARWMFGGGLTAVQSALRQAGVIE